MEKLKMKKSIASLFVALLSTSYVSADPIIFPAQGQSAEQQEKDKFECYSWAKKQSGFDPMSSTDTATAQAQAQTKSGGAAKGALVGGVAGAVFGNKSKHTRRSAAAGAVVGGASQNSSNRKSQDAANQYNAGVAGGRSGYDRAHAACLEGKGYTVK